MAHSFSKRFKKYLFLLHDGFFELPYLSNSPENVYGSVAELGIAQHDSQQQSVRSNNLFCNGELRYRQLDQGFWLLGTTIKVKQNIVAKAIYDNADQAEYFYLSFSVFEYPFPLPGADANALQSVCWTFYKPNTEVATYFYKGTRGTFYNIAFTREWADKNLLMDTPEKTSALQNFLNSDTGFLTWLDVLPSAHVAAKNISELLSKPTQVTADQDSLRIETKSLVSDFFRSELQNDRIQSFTTIRNPNYGTAARAEKIILQRLTLPFSGVDEIAKEVNVSTTKLKANFKAVFGFSMLQYHKEKNMQIAIQLLRSGLLPIRTVASLTGYECGSKFAAAFRKRFSVLPSEV